MKVLSSVGSVSLSNSIALSVRRQYTNVLTAALLRGSEEGQMTDPAIGRMIIRYVGGNTQNVDLLHSLGEWRLQV